MSDTKQTAVEWIIQQYDKGYGYATPEQIKQALAMEREQIIESYYAGTSQFSNEAEIVRSLTPEQYYTDTYGNK